MTGPTATWRRHLRHEVAAGRLLAGIVFVLAWQLVVLVGDYPRFILPGPLVVGRALRERLDAAASSDPIS